MTAEYLRTLARYNHWANGLLYDAVAGIPEAEYRRERRAFFGSIHGTLNHLLVGDRIWLCRVAGEPDPVKSLDEILCEDLPSLRTARVAEDAHIIETVEGFDDAALEVPLAYTLSSGRRARTPHRLVFAHLFNHQTHHRGQVHDMLSQTGMKPPQLDLLYFVLDEG